MSLIWTKKIKVEFAIRIIAAQLLLLFFGVTSCSEPVRRDLETPQSSVKSSNPKESTLPLSDLKKPIWILEFEPEFTTASQNLKQVPIADILKSQLRQSLGQNTSPFLVQSEDEEMALIQRLSLGDSESFRVTEISQLKSTDVSGFLKGKISAYDMYVDGEKSEGIFKLRTVTLRLDILYELIDAATGKVVATGRDMASISESRSDFLSATPELSDLKVKSEKLAKIVAEKVLKRMTPFSTKLAWGARVLRIEGGRVYINAGKRAGLILGDTLKVIDRPREILDPQSGERVGEAQGRVKGTIKIIQFFGNDGAVGILQSGGGISTSDRVELY